MRPITNRIDIAYFFASAYFSYVKLSVKSDYAARAVLGLARHYPKQEALRVEDLAALQGVPANYLVQILIELKGKGLIQSRRGKAGGYNLARSPREITVGDVVRAVHGEVVVSRYTGNRGIRRAFVAIRPIVRARARPARDHALMACPAERALRFGLAG